MTGNALAACRVEEPLAMSREAREEGEWVERARRGDEAACAVLIDRYRARAVRLAAHVLRRPSEAEDVAQEAFIRAFRHIGSFRGGGRFYTWLYQIIVRVCLDRRRTARWTAEVPPDEAYGLTNAETNAIDARLLVSELLDHLSPAGRAALVLREIEGLDYAEIAEVLCIPVGTVRSRLHVAREQFKAAYWAAVKESESV